MDTDGTPTLEVGFEVNFFDSFGQLKALDDIVGTTAAEVMREFQRLEKASMGAVNLSGATAQITSFGNAASRELREVAQANSRVERAGEGVVRQLNRQIEVFGKTASEVREMRAELRAVEADSRGMTELAARIRAASAEMSRLEGQTNVLNTAARRGSGTMTQLSFQLNDVATMAASGSPPFQIFATQIGQIVQVAQQAEGGLKGFARELGSFALRFSPVLIAIGAVVAGFALFDRAVSKGIDTKKMVDGLGLTRDEIKKLKDTSISTGDVVKATFQELAASVGLNMTKASKWFSDAMDWMTVAGRQYLAALYSQFSGTFRAIGVIVKGVFSGKSIGEILKDVKGAYTGAFDDADKSLQRFGDRVRKRIADNKLVDLKKQADAIKTDRTPEKPKVDRQAETLALEERAIEAQIRNLYGLADAYRESGAAALIAEARVKAESEAIKKRADTRTALADGLTEDAQEQVDFIIDQISAPEIVASPTAAVYLCFGGQGASCSATSYSYLIPSGATIGTLFTPPAGASTAVFAFSTAAVTLKVSSQVAQ